MAEAMAMEKPVIATAWSGNLDFMTINNSFLVEYQLVSLEQSFGPYHRGQIWARPDVNHAAALMRQVYEQPELAKAKAARGARDVRACHSPTAVGRIIQERLTMATKAVPLLGHNALGVLHRNKPTLRQGIRFARHSLKTRPELILSAGWVKRSAHGWKGIWAKKIVQVCFRFFHNLKL